MASAEESVDLADRSGDALVRIRGRTTLADALHQAGQLELSSATFHEAEAIQAEMQPKHPRLYSLAGYRYCDLLLGAVRQGPRMWSGLDGTVTAPGEAERQQISPPSPQGCYGRRAGRCWSGRVRR